MPANPSIERNEWTASKINISQFKKRREPRLRYHSYTKRFNDILDSIKIIETEVTPHVDEIGLARTSLITRIRVDNILNWLSLQYSAGASPDLFTEIWPQAMTWAEEFAAYNSAFNASQEAGYRKTPHIILNSGEYWLRALRLICFGLLSGNSAQMPRVMNIVDPGNEPDGLLERMVTPFVPGRPPIPNIAIRHLPYRKLFKVFDATPEKRPTLMIHYLDGWYHSSRREPYFNHHDEDMFYGYWSWEAAAVTLLLDIDDSTYRDMPFYPNNLVEFGRKIPVTKTVQLPPPPSYAGHPCPRSGYWFTLAKHNSCRYFELGEIFPDIPSPTTKGLVLWQWSDTQNKNTNSNT